MTDTNDEKLREWQPSGWLLEMLEMYQQGLQEIHRKGIAQLLNSKNTIVVGTLESGQKIIAAYDQEPEQPDGTRKSEE
jgi:hypothetical protein